MQYGICHLSSIPVRSQADEAGEMLTQILYGEHFKVLETENFGVKLGSPMMAVKVGLLISNF